MGYGELADFKFIIEKIQIFLKPIYSRRCQMTSRSFKNNIILTGILTCLINIPASSFAYGPAPFNDASVVNKIRENMNVTMEEYSERGKMPEDLSGMDLALFFKETTIEAFKKSGYDFSETIALMAEKGIDKDDVLFQEIILSLIIQIGYAADGDIEIASKIFSETDTKNLRNISLAGTSKGKNMDLPDFNLFEQDEIDSLLKRKWKDMTNILKKGDIEGALEYFHSDKRDMYRRLFSSSPDEIGILVSTIKKMVIKDFDLNEVKYIADLESIYEGKSQTISLDIIFERDEDGIWRISHSF